MPEDTFRWVITGGVAIATLCILAMAVVTILLYKIVSKVQVRVDGHSIRRFQLIDKIVGASPVSLGIPP